MNRHSRNIAALLATLWIALTNSPVAAKRAEEFDASIRLTYGTSDGRAQVRFQAQSNAGLRMLHVRDPQGKLAVKVISRDGGRLGQSLLYFEAAESSLNRAFEAYPPGEYRFTGWTDDGRILTTVSVLSPDLPDPPVITFPADGQSGLSPASLTASWQAVADAGGYGVETDSEDTEASLTADLPPRTLSFSFPASWFSPGRLYTLDVAARGPNGNQTVSSVTFTTAP